MLQKTKSATFRLKPRILEEFDYLEKVLNKNRTQILSEALDSYFEKIKNQKQNHPLAYLVGSVSQKDGKDFDEIIRNAKNERIEKQSDRDSVIQELFN